ncbi:hypothetical protein BGX23_011254 [Mortierella sp. AD031]|nr:hypothetical protein BGX23_011254 [Mortierella sp. AD031]
MTGVEEAKKTKRAPMIKETNGARKITTTKEIAMTKEPMHMEMKEPKLKEAKSMEIKEIMEIKQAKKSRETPDTLEPVEPKETNKAKTIKAAKENRRRQAHPR